MPIIEIQNLTHRFTKGTAALENVDLAIRAGEFVLIAGPNGSGKTTLLHHFNGLLLPTHGRVTVAGFPVAENLVQVRQMVGMVFQNPDSQIVGETVYDDIAFGPENIGLHRSEIQDRVQQAARRVKLDQYLDHRPYELSGGEKRRLTIAGVLAMHPRIVVLDEPLNSLDYPGVKRVLKTILELQSAGLTIIMATHDLEKVVFHADRLIILNKGQIVEDGPPARVLPKVESYGVREPCASRWGRGLESWLG